MSASRLITQVKVLSTFIATLDRTFRDTKLKEEAIATTRSLLLADLDALPRKLHLHMLTGKMVASAEPASGKDGKKVPAWTFHITPSDDKYKASFTYENGVVYLRQVGEHDAIDKRP